MHVTRAALGALPLHSSHHRRPNSEPKNDFGRRWYANSRASPARHTGVLGPKRPQEKPSPVSAASQIDDEMLRGELLREGPDRGHSDEESGLFSGPGARVLAPDPHGVLLVDGIDRAAVRRLGHGEERLATNVATSAHWYTITGGS